MQNIWSTCDSLGSVELPGARLLLQIACWDVFAFQMFNTSRLCTTSSTNKTVKSCVIYYADAFILLACCVREHIILFF